MTIPPVRLLFRCLLAAFIAAVALLFDAELLRLLVLQLRGGEFGLSIVIMVAFSPLHLAVYLLLAPTREAVAAWWRSTHPFSARVKRSPLTGTLLRSLLLIGTTVPAASLIFDAGENPFQKNPSALALVILGGAVLSWWQFARDTASLILRDSRKP